MVSAVTRTRVASPLPRLFRFFFLPKSVAAMAAAAATLPTPLQWCYQERIEPAKPAREHATAHVHYIDGEIQTWPSYSKYSRFRIR